MTTVRRALTFLALLGLLALAGCKQSKGERCQLASDCECGQCVIVSGLEGLCCEGNAVVDSGMNMSVDSSVVDASVIDASTPDAQAADSGTD
jgi:hypothetical protein